jgi:hypothetical protein
MVVLWQDGSVLLFASVIARRLKPNDDVANRLLGAILALAAEFDQITNDLPKLRDEELIDERIPLLCLRHLLYGVPRSGGKRDADPLKRRDQVY